MGSSNVGSNLFFLAEIKVLGENPLLLFLPNIKVERSVILRRILGGGGGGGWRG